jgi:hypothetical protein
MDNVSTRLSMECKNRYSAHQRSLESESGRPKICLWEGGDRATQRAGYEFLFFSIHIYGQKVDFVQFISKPVVAEKTSSISFRTCAWVFESASRPLCEFCRIDD